MDDIVTVSEDETAAAILALIEKQKLIAGMSHDLKSPPDLYPGL